MAQENFSSQLADLLVTRNFDIELKDASGNDTSAEDAKTMSFDYVASSGNNYGRMVLILQDGNDLLGMFGDNLGRSMEDPDDKEEFLNFQQQLHDFSVRNRWHYTPTDISQLKHVMRGMAAMKEGLFESYYGNRRISYMGDPTQARLVINHVRPLGEQDARYRHIDKMFIETVEGERYKLQFNNIGYAKAMLEHVRQGGRPYDVRGNHITEMVSEIAVLSRFNRASANRVLEGVTAELVTEAQSYYSQLRETVRRLSLPSGYRSYFENWEPTEITLQEELVDSIKTMFIEQTIDVRIEAALPLLARLRQNTMKEAEIFESWANRLVEGTWSLPDTPEKWQKLQELMSEPLMVGAGAMNATEQLDDIVGDDILFDRLQELAKEDPNANCWDDTEVQARLQQLGVSLNVNQNQNQETETPAQISEQQGRGMGLGKQNLVPWEGGPSGGFGGYAGGGGGGGGRGFSGGGEKFMGQVEIVPRKALPAPTPPSTLPASTGGPTGSNLSLWQKLASLVAGAAVGGGGPAAMLYNLSRSDEPKSKDAPKVDKPAVDDRPSRGPTVIPPPTNERVNYKMGPDSPFWEPSPGMKLTPDWSKYKFGDHGELTYKDGKWVSSKGATANDPALIADLNKLASTADRSVKSAPTIPLPGSTTKTAATKSKAYEPWEKDFPETGKGAPVKQKGGDSLKDIDARISASEKEAKDRAARIKQDQKTADELQAQRDKKAGKSSDKSSGDTKKDANAKSAVTEPKKDAGAAKKDAGGKVDTSVGAERKKGSYKGYPYTVGSEKDYQQSQSLSPTFTGMQGRGPDSFTSMQGSGPDSFTGMQGRGPNSFTGMQGEPDMKFLPPEDDADTGNSNYSGRVQKTNTQGSGKGSDDLQRLIQLAAGMRQSANPEPAKDNLARGLDRIVNQTNDEPSADPDDIEKLLKDIGYTGAEPSRSVELDDFDVVPHEGPVGDTIPRTGELKQESVNDPMNYNAAITGSYYESREPGDALLARIKSLALLK